MRIPSCSKTNPNPCVLIPWTKTPYSLEVFMRSLSTEAKQRFKRMGYLVMLPDPNTHLSWKYQVIEEVLMRRHLVKCMTPSNKLPEGPSFFCEVCGKVKDADDMKPVKCGWSAVDAMDYTICSDCIRDKALDRSMELGFYVRILD